MKFSARSNVLRKSCCVDEVAAQHINGDAIIHFGHACLSPNSQLPVFYVFPKKPFNVSHFYQELEKLRLEGPLLILYDVGISYQATNLRLMLPGGLKRTVVISELDKGGHSNPCSLGCSLLNSDKSRHETVKLGRAYCSPSQANFSTVIYIGENDSPNLRNFRCLLKGDSILSYSDEKLFETVSEANEMKRCSYIVERLKDSRSIGILIGTLGVTGYLEAVDYVKMLCKKSKKRTYIIAVGKPNPAKLANFPEIDIYVSISCPEANFGDTKEYLQPIVGVFEVDLAFNENRRWDSAITKDFRDLLPGGNAYVPCSMSESDSSPTVSLVTNKIRAQNSLCNESTDLTLRPDMTVGVNTTSISRTWNGLSQNLGDSPPHLAMKGRMGTASGYVGEGDLPYLPARSQSPTLQHYKHVTFTAINTSFQKLPCELLGKHIKFEKVLNSLKEGTSNSSLSKPLILKTCYISYVRKKHKPKPDQEELRDVNSAEEKGR